MAYLGKVPAAVPIDASDIPDNSITSAKLAGGTDGELITYDTAGDPAKVAVGTSGHVLTSGGTGVAPTFQAAAAGGVDGIVSTADATAITIDSSENVSFSNNTKIVGGNQQTQRLSWWNSTNYELASIENKSHGSYNDSGGLVFRTAAISSGGLQQRLEITSDGRGLSQFTAKAWGQMDMSNMSLNDSHNVSSVTDIGTGNARINLTNSLGNSSYAAVSSPPNGYISATMSFAAGNFNLTCKDTNGTSADADKNSFAVFGD